MGNIRQLLNIEAGSCNYRGHLLSRFMDTDLVQRFWRRDCVFLNACVLEVTARTTPECQRRT